MSCFFPINMRSATLLLGVLVLSACASPTHRAPVEDRKPPVKATAPASTPAPATPAVEAGAAKPVVLNTENAGRAGFYTIKPGDTLIRIGLDAGQNWRDIARWNNLDNVNLIEVGQVLRVVPPGADASAAVARPVAGAGRMDAKPLDVAKPGEAPGQISAPGAPAVPATAPAATVVPRDADEDLTWAWPAAGAVATTFDDVKSKGLAIAGKAGDPVLAAADGRVVYAGAGLRGYGNLVIVKHNATYLTAYAHNQTLLVKEDQAVRRGQKIAEMGSSDAERVQLHFEIRRGGKPIDPARLLPAR